MNDFTRESNKRWRLKHGSEDRCGMNTSALRSLITTYPITHILVLSQAECFMDGLLIMSWISNWEFVYSKHPFPLGKLPKMFLTKRRWSTKVFAEILSRLTSNVGLITTRRPTLQSSKKQITCMSYSRKQIIKGVKFLLRNFGGLALTLLKRCHQTTIIWYAKLAPTRRKCFIECDWVSSHPDNPYPIYRSHLKKGNLIRKWALNTMICMPERGSVTMKGHFSTFRIFN